jgi:penicillin V acylase-like amidase (Ntn superfamily)
MDWKTHIPANLWIFTRAMDTNGEEGINSLKWKSKYGSVITSSWNITSSDGMNEKGLVSNLLWLTESSFPTFEKNGNKKGLAVSLWL